MAGRLELPFHSIEYAPDRVLSHWERIVRTYTLPFSDYSILPTWWLSQHVTREFGGYSVALDGTAADAAFGFFDGLELWRKFYRLPELSRRAGAWLYARGEFWRRPSRAESVLRKFARTAGLPDFAGNLAVHPLRGIGFRPNPADAADLVAAMTQYHSELFPAGDPDLAFCALDIVHQCAGVLAQKDQSVFSASGMRLGFPFLEPKLLRLALERVRFWPGTREKKASLKRLLARAVPPSMVYRPKAGFVIPQEHTFSHPEFLGRLDTLLDDRAHPLNQWLDQRMLQSLRRALVARERLALFTYSFLWAAVYNHSWLSQAERDSRVWRSGTPLQFELR
jgi:asparagine synthetase B (glutamine-hydrolysing)